MQQPRANRITHPCLCGCHWLACHYLLDSPGLRGQFEVPGRGDILGSGLFQPFVAKCVSPDGGGRQLWAPHAGGLDASLGDPLTAHALYATGVHPTAAGGGAASPGTASAAAAPGAGHATGNAPRGPAPWLGHPEQGRALPTPRAPVARATGLATSHGHILRAPTALGCTRGGVSSPLSHC